MGFWSRLAGIGRRKSSDDVVGSELVGWYGGGGLSSSGVAVSSLSALQHTAVMACVTILSEDFAKLPLRLWKRLPKGGKEPGKDHPLYNLLRRPNAWQTRFEFTEMLQAALVLRGNGYAVKIRDDRGRVTSLVPVHPDRVTIFEAPGGEYFYAVTRQGLHDMAVLRDQPFLIHSDDMLHIKWMSTWNSLLGSSRVQMMRESIGVSMGQEQMAAHIVGSGARPSGVLMTEAKLAPDVVERIKSDWQQKHGGWRNSGTTAVLEQGLKWEPMSMTMVDAEFMESRRFQLEDIARGFRVPLYKLGISKESAGSSQVQQDQMYINDVLSSYGQRWSERLEFEWDIDGDEYFIELDYEHLMKADIQTRLTAKRTGVVGMIYTPNEARRGEGLPDVEGGDTLYQPTNVAPIGFTPAQAGGSGPGSDVTGEPAPGGDGDPAAVAPVPGDDVAPND